jgi:hypothetical protein
MSDARELAFEVYSSRSSSWIRRSRVGPQRQASGRSPVEADLPAVVAGAGSVTSSRGRCACWPRGKVIRLCMARGRYVLQASPASLTGHLVLVRTSALVGCTLSPCKQLMTPA